MTLGSRLATGTACSHGAFVGHIGGYLNDLCLFQQLLGAVVGLLAIDLQQQFGSLEA